MSSRGPRTLPALLEFRKSVSTNSPPRSGIEPPQLALQTIGEYSASLSRRYGVRRRHVRDKYWVLNKLATVCFSSTSSWRLKLSRALPVVMRRSDAMASENARTRPNENKMSDGGRNRASLGVEL